MERFGWKQYQLIPREEALQVPQLYRRLLQAQIFPSARPIIVSIASKRCPVLPSPTVYGHQLHLCRAFFIRCCSYAMCQSSILEVTSDSHAPMVVGLAQEADGRPQICSGTFSPIFERSSTNTPLKHNRREYRM